ncbi:hypothetical protein MMC10_005265 [Thelotrema lepadinum]|nr:hypothetical protein [Thelotrema lepadinum]
MTRNDCIVFTGGRESSKTPGFLWDSKLRYPPGPYATLKDQLLGAPGVLSPSLNGPTKAEKPSYSLSYRHKQHNISRADKNRQVVVSTKDENGRQMNVIDLTKEDDHDALDKKRKRETCVMWNGPTTTVAPPSSKKIKKEEQKKADEWQKIKDQAASGWGSQRIDSLAGEILALASPDVCDESLFAEARAAIEESSCNF